MMTRTNNHGYGCIALPLDGRAQTRPARDRAALPVGGSAPQGGSPPPPPATDSGAALQVPPPPAWSCAPPPPPTALATNRPTDSPPYPSRLSNSLTT